MFSKQESTNLNTWGTISEQHSEMFSHFSKQEHSFSQEKSLQHSSKQEHSFSQEKSLQHPSQNLQSSTLQDSITSKHGQHKHLVKSSDIITYITM